MARAARGTPTAAPIIVPVLLFVLLVEEEFAAAVAVVDEEDVVVDVDDVEVVSTAPAVEPALEVLVVGSANIVPKVGVKVESVLQQFVLLYAQHHVPPVVAASHAITFTDVLFPAICHFPCQLSFFSFPFFFTTIRSTYNSYSPNTKPDTKD